MTAQVRRFPMPPDRDALLVMLTATQLKIVQMMMDGASMQRLSEELKISREAVQSQIEMARKHTGCNNSVQLAALLMRGKVL